MASSDTTLSPNPSVLQDAFSSLRGRLSPRGLKRLRRPGNHIGSLPKQTSGWTNFSTTNKLHGLIRGGTPEQRGSSTLLAKKHLEIAVAASHTLSRAISPYITISGSKSFKNTFDLYRRKSVCDLCSSCMDIDLADLKMRNNATKKQRKYMHSSGKRETKELWKNEIESNEFQEEMDQTKLLKQLTNMMYQMQNVLIGSSLGRETHFVSRHDFSQQKGNRMEPETLKKKLSELHNEKKWILTQSQVSDKKHEQLQDQFKQSFIQTDTLKSNRSPSESLKPEDDFSDAKDSWEMASVGFASSEKNVSLCCSYGIVEKICQCVQDLVN